MDATVQPTHLIDFRFVVIIRLHALQRDCQIYTDGYRPMTDVVYKYTKRHEWLSLIHSAS